MLFNSLAFCVFFPVVTLGYFALPHRFRWAWLLTASCAFYMAFVPAYILILGGTIVVDYVAGLLIAKREGRRRKLWLSLSIAANVGVLAVFKYWAFLRGNVGSLTELLGSPNPIPELDILLPIGLSFHTFQAMSYTIEVYRGNQAPERHFGIYALYVMFYPQLVAGPIERPQNLLQQFRVEHRFEYERVVSGLQLMALGMFKKVVLADRLAAVSANVWANPSRFSGTEVAVAILLFSFQIYLDFSAYSEIAIGSARVMGFDLTRNFDFPYFSRSLGEFWRRWHISLSTWFRDYVYTPLGGNRSHATRNVVIVFLLSGLWHGASWPFVIWGALHGAFLLLEKLTRIKPGVAVTFAIVSLAWVFFRAPTFTHATTMLERLASPGNLSAIAGYLPYLLTCAAVLGFDWLHRRRDVFTRLRAWPAPVRHLAYAAVVYSTLLLAVPHDVQFIYFQF